MSQLTTFLLDSAGPNSQVLPFSLPIFWTGGRIYTFAEGISFLVTNKALFYKSLDGGVTWTKPDSGHATVCNGQAVFFWDGVSQFSFMMIFALNGGAQPLILQSFDLDNEVYLSPFGSFGAPTLTISRIGGIFRTADGSIFCFYDKITGGPGHVRAIVDIFVPPPVPAFPPQGIGFAQIGQSQIGGGAPGGVWSGEIDYGTNIAGVFSGYESAIVDSVNNRVHVFYTDGANNYFYRQIKSDGTLSAIVSFPVGFNLTPSNLNDGRSFYTGYIRAGALIIGACSKDVLATRYFTVLRGTPLNAPVFTQSGPIDSGPVNSPIGSEPAQGIGFSVGTTDYVAYFMGDSIGNLYNLVKLATNSGGGWSTQTVYNATLDPNATFNPFNNQWLSTISGGVDPSGDIQYQFSVWHNYPGDANTTILNTKFAPGVPKLPKKIPVFTPGSGVANDTASTLLWLPLPDPKICKTQDQMRQQFQPKFRTVPSYARILKGFIS